MSGVAKINFDQPVQIYRTSARVSDGKGNLFLIIVTGRMELFKPYVENAPISLELIPPEAFKEFRPPTGRAYEEQEIKKEPPTEDPMSQLDIEISIVETQLDKYALVLTLDPTVPPDGNHNYYVESGWVQAWCTTSIGDADIYLY